MSGRKKLRCGYTTGACAAAAARAATLFLQNGRPPETVEIPFPDNSRHSFHVCRASRRVCGDQEKYCASVVKDAGDDPDVTNGAEIIATVWEQRRARDHKEDAPGGSLSAATERQTAAQGDLAATNDTSATIIMCAGEGVGVVTKPGLAVAVGEVAINPVPLRMIRQAVAEIRRPSGRSPLMVEISVTNGRELAKKTLNYRLGIVGGLSILGTTGIVRPVSAEAWTATITASMSVARAVGLSEIILSTGRTSEQGALSVLALPEEAGVMMGDYLYFSLQEAARHGFKKIHLAGMWAKIIKAALRIPQTHVRHGALEVADAVALLVRSGLDSARAEKMQRANTARELLTRLRQEGCDHLIRAVCLEAQSYAQSVSGLPVSLYLVDASAKILVRL